ncbi:putative Zn-dependent protease [Dysgonomonas sp. PFB1-18]|uniref:M48 family metallopeptidase n=1 Tax=unclassified Dysgonomonas TaxID=2630389 RepID=UPI0024749786|nr:MULTISPECIES: M48 family metalloprotease [unclassified Dysgonomonas]MDH6309161.1 putative Zn-dependent protease [Dysgonomonas sp. PF1-14]MDH6338959.1 putative Zn-dependent protease [Dysgonomonas sp. PF1-16]MDH6380410.1 putative Zn-dependent protease [Dysgonomonas sp. PFB1-18]MDH6397787.1 putative Zn-dependent protease [Dysgonomonas sp. PF1-23]
MKKIYLSLLLVATLMLFAGCSSVPVTGRKQLSLVSNQEVLTLSLQQYDEFIKSAPISTDKTNTAMVQRVGRAIASAVENYLTNNGYANEVASYAWEFNLVKSTDVNAFCMPGGKIVVYEGILPYTQNETGLAVVMGHEVAHAVAKHANERMSNQMATQYGTSAIGAALGGTSAATQQIAAAALGLGAQYGILLPYSRKQELEADKLGLIFMAMAGYDPSQAAAFWQRMSQQGGSTPEFMSTHPSDNTRIQQIQKDLPEALKYYKGAGVGTTNSAKTSNQWKF